VFRNPFSSIENGFSKMMWQICVPISIQKTESVHVDLGSGNLPRNPFGATRLIGTDFHSSFTSPDGIEFIQVDLTKKLPFADASIDSMSAFDVLEHIPRWERLDSGISFPFIQLMNEIYRCLKPGGVFLASTPAFPSPAAFQDPTHVNFISAVTINYFTGDSPLAGNLEYGFEGKFILICQTWVHRGVGGGNRPSRNLISEGITQKVTYLLSIPNIAKLSRVLINLITKRPSHLLWVISKPG
jgi:SAM-dependent methyltransferase